VGPRCLAYFCPSVQAFTLPLQLFAQEKRLYSVTTGQGRGKNILKGVDEVYEKSSSEVSLPNGYYSRLGPLIERAFDVPGPTRRVGDWLRLMASA
jgi:hypothetical protein